MEIIIISKKLKSFFEKINHFVNVEIDLRLWYSLDVKCDWSIVIIFTRLQWIK
jgi:hypothetical protein